MHRVGGQEAGGSVEDHGPVEAPPLLRGPGIGARQELGYQGGGNTSSLYTDTQDATDFFCQLLDQDVDDAIFVALEAKYVS